MRKIVVVLPAYNEEEGLPQLLASFQHTLTQLGADYKIIMVDDGSLDQTAKVAEEWAQKVPLQLVRHEVNRGLGAALMTGIKTALLDCPAEGVVVVMDADNTHNPAFIPAMLNKMAEGFDVVTASRFLPGSEEVGVPFLRKVGSHTISWLMRAVFRIPNLREYSCGYRAYRAAALQKALEVYGDRLLEEKGFAVTVELLIKLASLPAQIGEVPFILRYDLKRGASKMKLGRTLRGYWGLIRRRRKLKVSIPPWFD